VQAESADVGFDLHKQVLLSIDGSGLRDSPDRTRALLDEIVEKLRAVPDVERVSVADVPPLAGTFRRTAFPAELDSTDPANGTLSGTESVGPGFVSTAGMRLRRGRDFDEHDDPNAPMVALVNEAAAAAIWHGADPVGKRLRFLATNWDVHVIGVVNTVTSLDVGEPPQPIVYFPFKQHPSVRATIYARTEHPSAVAGAAHRLVASLEPRLQSARIRTGTEMLDRLLANRRVGTEVLTAFSLVALVLAGLGTYGVVTYGVSQRRRELAIRVALGSSTTRIVRQIVASSLMTSACGVLVGLVMSALGGASIANLLYGVRAFDGPSFALSGAILLAVALLAAWIPARRATRADPMTVLRGE